MKIEKLGSFEKDELLRFFLHTMPQEQRRILMFRFPQHYNKMADREIMEVRNITHES